MYMGGIQLVAQMFKFTMPMEAVRNNGQSIEWQMISTKLYRHAQA